MKNQSRDEELRDERTRLAREAPAILALFADRDRRRLLLYLVDGNPEDLDDIPEHIRVADHIDKEERRTLLERLETEHLPLLEENGIVEWDRERNVIVRGERFDEIRPLLGLIADHGDELPDDWR
jgi:DNA-binding transcriptional ArsR family regulator